MTGTAELVTQIEHLLPRMAETPRGIPDLATILARLPVIVRVISTDGTYLLSEGQGLALIGRTPGDLVGESVFTVQRERPDILADMRRVLAGEELHTVRALNGYVWETQYTPLYEDGVLIGTLYMAMEVTARARAEAQLRESEERFRSAFAHAAIGMALVGLSGRWLRVNRALCALLGYSEEELLAVDFQSLTHPDDLAPDLQQLAALLDGAIENYQLEKRYRHRNGCYIWVLLSVSLVRDEQGAPVHFIAQIQDIDRRKEAEEALRKSEERYRELHAAAARQAQEMALLDRIRMAVARELDPAAVCQTVVEGIAATFGYTQVSLYLREDEEHVLQHQVGYDRVLARIPVAAGVTGRAVRERRALLLEDVATDPTFLGAIDGITSEICVPLYDAGQPAGFLNVESTGGVRLGAADLRLMEALGEQVGIALERARLYGVLREREARLAQLAAHDPLTGLANRRQLGETLTAALARLRQGGASVALLYIDLDDFKAVNDALGHEAGDYLLGEVADRLRLCVRANDLPGRLGGDEFAILLEGAGELGIRAAAARVVTALSAPVQIGRAEVTISASVGAVLAEAGETADALLRRADAALYGAKRAGKDRYLFAAS